LTGHRDVGGASESHRQRQPPNAAGSHAGSWHRQAAAPRPDTVARVAACPANRPREVASWDRRAPPPRPHATENSWQGPPSPRSVEALAFMYARGASGGTGALNPLCPSKAIRRISRRCSGRERNPRSLRQQSRLGALPKAYRREMTQITFGSNRGGKTPQVGWTSPGTSAISVRRSIAV